jgi:hypothetical protein
MPRVSWQSRSDGLYWIDIALGSRHFSLMIDIGLVDPKHQVGFSIEPQLFDLLRKSGELSGFFVHSLLDASGKVSRVRSGLLAAQLISPITQLPVGPRVHLHAVRGSPGVPNRVGVGCQVNWDLDKRTWSIDLSLLGESREHPAEHIRRLQLVKLAGRQHNFRLRMIHQQRQQRFIAYHELQAVRQRAERERINLASH